MPTKRKTLPHAVPNWVKDGAIYYVTIGTTPPGTNQLCEPETAAVLKESLFFRETREDWWLYLLVFMPDQLHALMSFGHDVSMQHALGEWKKHTARVRRIRWQRDLVDHRLRKDENFAEKALDIRMNPVRAGLVATAEEWPYTWAKGR